MCRTFMPYDCMLFCLMRLTHKICLFLQINRTGSQGGAMQARNNEIMDILQTYGYSPINHAELSELIVNTFGILSEKPPCQQTLDNYNNRDYLHKLIVDYAPPNFVNDLLVFLNSLWHLSVADGKPMFLW